MKSNKAKMEALDRYECNAEVIKASGVDFKEVKETTVFVFPVAVEGKPCSAVFYASVGRFMVNTAKLDEFMAVEDAVNWVKEHQRAV